MDSFSMDLYGSEIHGDELNSETFGDLGELENDHVLGGLHDTHDRLTTEEEPVEEFELFDFENFVGDPTVGKGLINEDNLALLDSCDELEIGREMKLSPLNENDIPSNNSPNYMAFHRTIQTPCDFYPSPSGMSVVGELEKMLHLEDNKFVDKSQITREQMFSHPFQQQQQQQQQLQHHEEHFPLIQQTAGNNWISNGSSSSGHPVHHQQFGHALPSTISHSILGPSPTPPVSAPQPPFPSKVMTVADLEAQLLSSPVPEQMVHHQTHQIHPSPAPVVTPSAPPLPVPNSIEGAFALQQLFSALQQSQSGQRLPGGESPQNIAILNEWKTKVETLLKQNQQQQQQHVDLSQQPPIFSPPLGNTMPVMPPPPASTRSYSPSPPTPLAPPPIPSISNPPTLQDPPFILDFRRAFMLLSQKLLQGDLPQEVFRNDLKILLNQVASFCKNVGLPVELVEREYQHLCQQLNTALQKHPHFNNSTTSSAPSPPIPSNLQPASSSQQPSPASPASAVNINRSPTAQPQTSVPPQQQQTPQGQQPGLPDLSQPPPDMDPSAARLRLLQQQIGSKLLAANIAQAQSGDPASAAALQQVFKHLQSLQPAISISSPATVSGPPQPNIAAGGISLMPQLSPAAVAPPPLQQHAPPMQDVPLINPPPPLPNTPINPAWLLNIVKTLQQKTLLTQLAAQAGIPLTAGAGGPPPLSNMFVQQQQQQGLTGQQQQQQQRSFNQRYNAYPEWMNEEVDSPSGVRSPGGSSSSTDDGKWMSQSEKQWLIKIMTKAITCENPYREEYYSTRLTLNRMLERYEQEKQNLLSNGVSHASLPHPLEYLSSPVTADELLTGHDVVAASMSQHDVAGNITLSPYRPPTDQYENSLGKITTSSFLTPRLLIDVTKNNKSSPDILISSRSTSQDSDSNNPPGNSKIETKPLNLNENKSLLMKIENLYVYVLRLDELAISLQKIVADTNSRSVMLKCKDTLIQQILYALRSDDLGLREILTVRKGCQLIVKFASYLDEKELLELFVMSFNKLSEIIISNSLVVTLQENENVLLTLSSSYLRLSMSIMKSLLCHCFQLPALLFHTVSYTLLYRLLDRFASQCHSTDEHAFMEIIHKLALFLQTVPFDRQAKPKGDFSQFWLIAERYLTTENRLSLHPHLADLFPEVMQNSSKNKLEGREENSD